MDITSYLLAKKGKGSAGVKYEVVDVLPEEGTIYLVTKKKTKQKNVYDEYMYINEEWELIGDTEVDLSGYQEKIDSTHKLDADLVDDTTSTNKFVTSAEKTTWNNKSDFSGSYNDLTDKPEIPVLTDALKYKGHANSFNNLPSQGQSSETPLTNVEILSHPDLVALNNGISTSTTYTNKINAFLNKFPNYKDTYGQYFVIYVNSYTSDTNYHFQSIRGFVTNYPEQLYFYTSNAGTDYSTMYLGAKYDANKPVYLVTAGNIVDSNTIYFNQITTDTKFDRPTDQSDSGYYYWRGFDKTTNPTVSMRLILNTPIKWEKADWSLSQTIDGETFVYSGNTYAFTGDENYNPIPVMSASDVTPYDLYSVGTSEDIYVGTTDKKWLKLSDLTKITGYDATKTQSLKNVNGTIEWVDE